MHRVQQQQLRDAAKYQIHLGKINQLTVQPNETNHKKKNINQ